MSIEKLDKNIFHDAVVEEIVNEYTLLLAIRINDSKIIKVCILDKIKEISIIDDDSRLKAIFLIDLISSFIPVGSHIKIKVLENNNITLFNKNLDLNINNLISIIQNSNANYKL